METINNKKYYIYHETEDKALKYLQKYEKLDINEIKCNMELYELLPNKLLKFLNNNHIIRLINNDGLYRSGGRVIENNFPETLVIYINGLKCCIEYEIEDNYIFLQNSSEKL